MWLPPVEVKVWPRDEMDPILRLKGGLKIDTLMLKTDWEGMYAWRCVVDVKVHIGSVVAR